MGHVSPDFSTGTDVQSQCPACEGRGLQTFYSVTDIPVHSVLLMPSRQAALDYPRGHLRLGFCPNCGFITNTLFDPSLHEYNERCEETQGYSPTFAAFAGSLADELVEKWALRGKTVLEIGCGKGEFLAALCERGVAKGIGIDPAYVPGRLTGEAASRIEFIQDLYSEKHSNLSADFVCCRHTLEHIAPTKAFVSLIRRTLGDSDTMVFFDLPDTARVLKEGAFWDIYYEHCSYFTAGSLARLFLSCGFDIKELRTDYAGQFLILTTATRKASPPSLWLLEDDLDTTTRLVAEFPEKCSNTLERWRSVIANAVQAKRRIVLWGSGSKAVAFASTLGLSEEIEYVVDINPHRHGKFIPGSGHEIIPPDDLKDYRPDLVIVMNPVYLDEIREDLTRLEIQTECIAL